MRQNFTQKFLTIFAFLSFFAAGYQANAQSQDPCEGDNGGMIATDNPTTPGTDTTCPRTAPGTFLSTNAGSGVGGGPNISYQWFMRNTNGGQFTAVPSYGTAADQTGTNVTYTPQALADGVYEYIRFRYSGTELNPRACARTSNVIQVIAQDRLKPVITRAPLDTTVIAVGTNCSRIVRLPRRGTGTGAFATGRSADARGVQATDNCTGQSSRTTDTLSVQYFIGSTRIAQNDSLGHSFPIGFTRVRVRVTDSTGNFADTAFTVRVTDTTRPTFGASPRLLVRFTEGTGSNQCAANITGSETDANYTDCSPMTITYTIFDSTANNTRTTPSSGVSGLSSGTTSTNIGDRTFQRGTYYIVYSSVDSFGNASNTADTLIVRVIDNVRPFVSTYTQAGPGNSNTFQFGAGSSNCRLTVSDAGGSGQFFFFPADQTDNCGVTSLRRYGPNDLRFEFNTANSNPANGPVYDNTFFRVGRDSISFVVRDASGNRSDSVFQYFTIIDFQRPVVFCGANQTVTTQGRTTMTSDACRFNVPTDRVTFNDPNGCPVRVVRYFLSGATTDQSPETGINDSVTVGFRVGVTTVKFVAYDTTGNGGLNASDTCSFTVTVTDNTPPAVSCKNFTLRLSSAGSGTLAPTDVLQSGSDCGPGALTYTLSKTAFDCSNIGTNTVTLTARDAAGNTNTCTATVTVVSNITFSVATTGEFCTNSGTLTISNVQGGSGTNSFSIVNGPTVNTTGATSGTFTGLAAGSYTVRVSSSGGANSSTCTKDTTVTLGASQKLSTDPRIVARAINNFFSAPGTSNEVRVTVSEIGGQPADSIAFVVPKESGYTIAFGTGFDNANWTIDNSNANFVVFRKNQVNGIALACGSSSEVSLTITRNANETQGRPAFPVTFVLLPPSEQLADYRFNDRFTVLFSAAQGQ